MHILPQCRLLILRGPWQVNKPSVAQHTFGIARHHGVEQLDMLSPSPARIGPSPSTRRARARLCCVSPPHSKPAYFCVSLPSRGMIVSLLSGSRSSAGALVPRWPRGPASTSRTVSIVSFPFARGGTATRLWPPCAAGSGAGYGWWCDARYMSPAKTAATTRIKRPRGVIASGASSYLSTLPERVKCREILFGETPAYWSCMHGWQWAMLHVSECSMPRKTSTAAAWSGCLERLRGMAAAAARRLGKSAALD